MYDPHPTFNGMAVDPDNNVVIMSDENRGSLLTYNLSDGSSARETTEPRWRVLKTVTSAGAVTLEDVRIDDGYFAVRSIDSAGGRSIAIEAKPQVRRPPATPPAAK